MTKIVNLISSAKLYKDTITIEEWKGMAFGREYHYYQKDKEKLLSSSFIAKVKDKSDVMMWWASGECKTFLHDYLNRSEVNQFTREELLPIVEEAVNRYKAVKEVAGDRGTRVHNFAEEFVKSKMGLGEMPEIPEDDEKVVNGITAFLDWYNQEPTEFIFAEKVVYSKKYNFAGRADAGCVRGGKKSLIDYKTGKGIYDDALRQVSSYFQAYCEEMGKDSLDDAVILHFNKETGEFKPKVLDKKQINIIYPYFLNCLELRKGEDIMKKILL